MSSKTTQEGQTVSTRRGRPRIPEQYKKHHSVHAQFNNLENEAFKALVDRRVKETGDAPNNQATLGWMALYLAKLFKIGPFSENGQ